MALSSSSTYANAIAQYNDNLSYEGSSSKAAAFVEACRWLLANRAQSSSDSSTSMTFESLENERDEALAHLKAIRRTYRSPFVRARPL